MVGISGRGWNVAVAACLAMACGDDEGSTDTTGVSGPTSGPGTGNDDDGGDGDPSQGDDDPSGAPTTGDDDPSTTNATDPTTSGSADDTTTGVSLEGCDNPDYIVCEDFEGAALGANPDGWALRSSGVYGGNGMGASDAQAMSGSQSFELHSGGSGAQWLTYQGDISAFANGYWGRMYFRMSDPVPYPGGGVIHGDLFEARGNWNGSTHQVRWAVINNANQMHNWGYNVQTSNAGEFIYETSYIYAWSEDWLCVEWHHDQAAQTATLWVDGEQLVDVTPDQDPQLPTFDDISVGWANYQNADPEFVVYIDDVVLDDERVGCVR